MAKRGLMDKVKQAVVKAGTPVARTLAKGTVAAVNTVDALSEKLPGNRKQAVTRATSVVKSAAESTMRATKPAAATRAAAPAADEGVAPPPTEARRVTAKRSAGPRTVSSASEATSAREMGAAPPPSEATRVTAAERARAVSRRSEDTRAAAPAAATRDAGRKTMPAAAAKRATKPAAKAPAKKQGFKAKRGQKHNHHR
jgi:hypothetical protein